ncbi:serine/threonine-protein kinase [Albidovulum sediminicola]|uniref:non-specific serine/threonine protein kinase n=1 Tax=Albidovulum sediminicola TaxID=2984331 RepID=A0ABT2Z5B6_9RHOB|nr:serine/threonine-protein kinase [Defluviimonas sp. WL0075]MCV2866261.1 protein kinase [Defluviimonas sp. WL0075]
MTAPQLAAEKASKEEFVDELKPGTRLLQGQYTISRFINSGGFGITYLAKDSLDRDVVIKECFPGSFCRRSDTIVGARSRAHQAEFKSIVKLFVQEARSLSKLVHPNIVGVHQVFEDNDTAYMAIDFIDGRDMLDIIERAPAEITPARLDSITRKLLKAVGFIHQNGILHRDISPDNILIDKTGEPILIDFGAAREEASRASRALSALRVVKDGYSPQEFYIAGSEQGPWSDLYALAATLYHAIAGTPAANSQVRLAAIAEGKGDPYHALAGRFPGYPVGFLEAIDKAMHAVPRKRIQSADEWLDMLEHPAPEIVNADATAAVSRLMSEQMAALDEPAAAAEPETRAAETAKAPEPAAPKPEAPVAATTAPPAEKPAPAKVQPKHVSSAPSPAPLPEARGGSGRSLLLGLSTVAVLAVLGFVVMQMGEKAPAADVPAEPTASASVAALPAPEPEKTTEAAPEAPPAPEPVKTAEAAPEAQSAPEAPAAPPVTAAAEPEAQAPAPEPEVAAPESEPILTAAAAVAVEDAPAEGPAPAETAAAVMPAAEEAAAAEPATAPSEPVEVAPAPVPVANQIAFALWDVTVPFNTQVRSIGGVNYANITSIDEDADLSVAGDWIMRGTTIFSVNGNPVSPTQNVGALILRNLTVERDGLERASVRIKLPGNAQYSRVQLVVPVLRRVGLVEGVRAAARRGEDSWVTTVREVGDAKTSLREGDVILSETATGLELKEASSLEDVMRGLVRMGKTVAEFEVLRNNVKTTASLNLAVE